MVSIVKHVQCTAKPDPKPWTTQNGSGITYRVSISDGVSNLELKCKDVDVYNKFEPFQFYQVALDVMQVASNNYIVERVRVVDCQIEAA